MMVRQLLMSFLVGALYVTVATAGPITGQPAGQPSDQAAASQAAAGPTETSFSAGSLFDHSGTTILLSSGLHHLELGTRNKLRHVDGGGFSDYSGGYASSSAANSGIPGMPGLGVDSSPLGNLTPEFPLGSTAPLSLITPASIPEPTALMLLAPALLVLARRRARNGR